MPVKTADIAGNAPAKGRVLTLALAFLIMNTTIGLSYGPFGPLVPELVTRFDTRLSLVSLCMSALVLNAGAQGPVFAFLSSRFTLRRIMMIGTVLSALGYAGLALSGDIVQVLLCYALLIGPGAALAGGYPCMTLISNWFDRGRGRAVGFISMPLVTMAMPPLTTALLPTLGFSKLMIAFALIQLALLPIMMLLKDRPDRIMSAAASDADAVPPVRRQIPVVALLRDRRFLLMTLGTGLVAGTGVSKSVHYFKLLVESGNNPAWAALLLSITSAGGLVGALVIGAIVDRFSASRALAINAGALALVWFMLLLPIGFPLLVADAILIGVCVSGFIAAKSVLVARLYGPHNFARVIGVSGPAMVPFLFGMAPLAGLLRERSGNYDASIWMHVICLLIASICFWIVGRHEGAAVKAGYA